MWSHWSPFLQNDKERSIEHNLTSHVLNVITKTTMQAFHQTSAEPQRKVRAKRSLHLLIAAVTWYETNIFRWHRENLKLQLWCALGMCKERQRGKRFSSWWLKFLHKGFEILGWKLLSKYCMICMLHDSVS